MFKRAAARPKPEKHLPYFKFVQALAGAGCPICAQVRLSLDDWFENLLYESANDRPLRKRFDADHGLCAKHAHRLCSSRESDGLGAAIVYRNVLEIAVARLSAGKAPELNTGTCVACDHEADAESRYVGLVADFLDEDEMRAGLTSSAGLCMPHLAAVMRLRKMVPPWFVEHHRGRCGELLAILLRYIDSFKLSTEERRATLTRDEELAWKRIAALLVGEAGS
ncbi:MAG: hypothetical protein Q8M76_12295 [Spirochaetaceae bacterium]|nr:hypothetical protein [Spirochaetaceae bacterium]